MAALSGGEAAQFFGEKLSEVDAWENPLNIGEFSQKTKVKKHHR